MKIVSILFIFLSFLSCGKNSTTNSTEKTQQEIISNTYLDMVNQHRKSLGLRTLIQSETIKEIAQKHSDSMANGKVRFGHSGWKQRCGELNSALGSSACSEIVAMGQKDT